MRHRVLGGDLDPSLLRELADAIEAHTAASPRLNVSVVKSLTETVVDCGGGGSVEGGVVGVVFSDMMTGCGWLKLVADTGCVLYW